MAKGRRLTTSRSERYLGSYGYGNNHSHHGNANDAPELVEDDVWSMVDDRVEHDHHEIIMNNNESGNNYYNGGNGLFRNPPEGRHVGGLSLAFEDSIPPSEMTTSSRILHQFRGSRDRLNPPSAYHMATSAPVNVPDWSKIYRVDSVESLHDSDDGFEDRDSEMVPPHEYLAREYARSKKMGGASVFEGVGRTLKGRDMSRVRDAVWSQTGFDG